MPTIDHRGPEFATIAREVLTGLKSVFRTQNPVVVFPSSGSGAWEAAFVNTLSSGDKVLAFGVGHFATLWKDVATNLGLGVEFVDTDWRRGIDPSIVEAKLIDDKDHAIRAVLAIHNETSTGTVSDIAKIRRAIDRAGHPTLLFVDAISSLGCIDLHHDDWGIDVTISCSQKGLMLPPGLGFNAISEKALKASKNADLPKSYWDWSPMLSLNEGGYFPYTPATNLLFGLREALLMLQEEGLDNALARHSRLAEATRRAVRAWGLEIVCIEPREYSNALTAIYMPEHRGADDFRRLVLERYSVSLGSGLGKLTDAIFRIGHLGDFNEAMLAGTLSAIEMGLRVSNTPFSADGVRAALDYLVAETT